MAETETPLMDRKDIIVDVILTYPDGSKLKISGEAYRIKAALEALKEGTKK